MPKVVINRCYGGFGLSEAAYTELGLEWDNGGFAFEEDRANPRLVAAVEKLGDAASGDCAELRVVDVPDGDAWEIHSNDGKESVVREGALRGYR